MRAESDNTIPVGHKAILGASLAVGALLRLWGLTRQGLWVDELYVVWEGRQSLQRIFDPNIHVQHPPGYRLALHLWMGAGTGEWWLRVLPALAGTLLIGAVWWLARVLWPRRPWAASLAALLVATSPFLLHYSQDVTTYSWTSLWLTLSFALLALAWRRDEALLWAGWGVCALVSLFSHYFAAFALVAQGVGVGVAWWLARARARVSAGEGAGAGRRLVHALAAGGSAAALFFVWMGVVYSAGRDLPSYLFPLSVDAQPVRWVPLLVAGYSNPHFWLYTDGALYGLWGVLAACAGLGLWRLRRAGAESRWGAALLAGWCVLSVVGPYFFLRLTTPPDAVDPVRFAAFSVPPLLAGLAGVMAVVPAAVRGALLALWLGVAGVQWWAEVTGPPNQDWRGLMGVVAAQGQPDEVFLAFPAFHAGAAASYYVVPPVVQGGWFVEEGGDQGGAGYWFPAGWRWEGFFNTRAYRSAAWRDELAARVGGAKRLWYLAGDGLTDGTYRPSAGMERALSEGGWGQRGEWRETPLVLRLYTRP